MPIFNREIHLQMVDFPLSTLFSGGGNIMDKSLSWAVSLRRWFSMPGYPCLPLCASWCWSLTAAVGLPPLSCWWLRVTVVGFVGTQRGDAMSHHHPMQLRPAICSVSSKALGALDSTPKVWQNSFWMLLVQTRSSPKSVDNAWNILKI